MPAHRMIEPIAGYPVGVRPQQDVILGDRYELQRRLAVGGMGEVWEATDTVLARAVAVKILKEEFRTTPSSAARFRAEARHAGGLSHPGIASVYDYGETDDVAYLVMELVAGQPLSELMVQQPDLSDLVKLSILGQTADALEAAHAAGVIHRDVKPGNLIVRPDGTVKVTDFGIARAQASAALTDTGQIVGTAAYVSPEQATGAEVTAASDVYSWGVVAYELFAGRLPFERDTAVALAHAHVFDAPPPLPGWARPGVVTLIGSALEKDPSRRPASAAEVAACVRAEMDAMRGAAVPSSMHPPAPAPMAWSEPADPAQRSTSPTAQMDRPPDTSASSAPIASPARSATPRSTMVWTSGPHPPAFAPAVGSTGLAPMVPRDHRTSWPGVIFLGVLLAGAAAIWAMSSRSDAVRDTSASLPPTMSDGADEPMATTAPASAPTEPSASAPPPEPSTEPTPTEPSPTEPSPTEPPSTTVETTAPPSLAPVDSTPTATAPSTPSAPAAGPAKNRVAEVAAVPFVLEYYERLAAGDFETTWASLSTEFREARELTFERYVEYWESTTIEIGNLRFRPGPGNDQGRVRFDARYVTDGRVVDETDEITLRHAPDGSLVITEQRVV